MDQVKNFPDAFFTAIFLFRAQVLGAQTENLFTAYLYSNCGVYIFLTSRNALLVLGLSTM